MKKISVLVICTLLFSCKKEMTNVKTADIPEKQAVLKTYNGFLKESIPFFMRLEFKDSLVKGEYEYLKVGKPIHLEGLLIKDSLILKEFDGKNVHTATFRGVVSKRLSEISGKWLSAVSAQKSGFKMTEGTKQQESNAISNIEGEYESPSSYEDETGGYYGNLSIRKEAGNKYYFEIKIGDPNCTGEAKGYFVLDENGTGKHSSEECKDLVFEFKKDKVVVKEGECDAHGINCSFEDEYLKK